LNKFVHGFNFLNLKYKKKRIKTGLVFTCF
jgi:hypothetical protein